MRPHWVGLLPARSLLLGLPELLDEGQVLPLEPPLESAVAKSFYVRL